MILMLYHVVYFNVLEIKVCTITIIDVIIIITNNFFVITMRWVVVSNCLLSLY